MEKGESYLRLCMAVIVVLACLPWGVLASSVEASIPDAGPHSTTGNATINESIWFALQNGATHVNITVTEGSSYQVNLTNNSNTFMDTMGVNVTIHPQDEDDMVHILLNGSLRLNGTNTWFSSPQQITFHQDSNLDVSNFNNASLIQIFGENTTISAPTITITGDGNKKLTAINHTIWASNTPFNNSVMTIINNAKIGLEIFGSNSNFSKVTLATGIGDIGANVTGDMNVVQIISLNSGKYCINLSGSNNTITAPAGMTAPSGHFYIDDDAADNKITLTGLPGENPFGIPYVYNGSAFKTTKIWYFFNSTQSASGANMNMSVNLTGFPFYGNVSLGVNATNLTGSANDWWSEKITTTSGGKGTVIHENSTKDLTFAATIENPAMFLPLKTTLGGGNTVFDGTSQKATLDNYPPIVIVNFDPMFYMPDGPGDGVSWNTTLTTNWTEIEDFTSVEGLVFAVNGSSGLLGNLTLAEAVNLTDQDFAESLSALGESLRMTNTTLGINMSIEDGLSALNKTAVLTLYPQFDFNESALSITHVSDTGVETPLVLGGEKGYQFGTYAEGFSSDNSTYIEIRSKSFSFYTFGNSTATPTPAPTPGPTPAPSDGSSGSQVGISSGITAGTGTTLVYSGLPVSEIRIVSDADIPAAIIIVDRLRRLGPGMNPPKPDVYQYLEITPHANTAQHMTDGATISFHVPVGYLTAMGMTTNDVALLRYVNGEWVQLKTTLVKIEKGIAYYEATTPGFSTFAIALQKDGAEPVIVSEPVETSVPEVVEPDTSEEGVAKPVPVTPSAPTPTPEPADLPPVKTDDAAPFPTAYVLITLVVIILIAGGAYYVIKKKDTQS